MFGITEISQQLDNIEKTLAGYEEQLKKPGANKPLLKTEIQPYEQRLQALLSQYKKLPKPEAVAKDDVPLASEKSATNPDAATKKRIQLLREQVAGLLTRCDAQLQEAKNVPQKVMELPISRRLIPHTVVNNIDTFLEAKQILRMTRLNRAWRDFNQGSLAMIRTATPYLPVERPTTTLFEWREPEPSGEQPLIDYLAQMYENKAQDLLSSISQHYTDTKHRHAVEQEKSGGDETFNKKIFFLLFLMLLAVPKANPWIYYPTLAIFISSFFSPLVTLCQRHRARSQAITEFDEKAETKQSELQHMVAASRVARQLRLATAAAAKADEKNAAGSTSASSSASSSSSSSSSCPPPQTNRPF